MPRSTPDSATPDPVNPAAFKHAYDEAAVRRIAAAIAAATPLFDAEGFLDAALPSVLELELKARVKLLAETLHAHLPLPFPDAVAALLLTLGPPGAPSGNNDLWGPHDIGGPGLTSFGVWPLTHFVARYGLAHPVAALDALEGMTRRSTAEFALRPYLLEHRELTLTRLREWVVSPDQHLRRAASEATRPRLPWGIRLRPFVADPEPVIALITPLRADPEDYVQRSVGNNLNDIAKDHPDRVLAVARDWSEESHGAATDRILRRALRSLVKQGVPEALRLGGFTVPAAVQIEDARISASTVVLGETLELGFTLVSLADHPQQLLVDYVLRLVRARGRTGEKVFKGRPLTLAPRERRAVTFKLSMRAVTTRRYYEGVHRLQIQLCGERGVTLPFTLALPA